ncbi:MAG: nickel pincer cofactor biosynthesis protein LarB [Chthonomonadales bacterium]|nr:nickel pincer cofactor biosynthesis protein LarB [Chthonomonadales bacterium]
MQPEQLRRLLEQVRDGAASVDEALQRLRSMPYEDLGFARVDHHRALRTGFPEVIYCPGKTVSQVVQIAERLARTGAKVMATRADGNVAEAMQAAFPHAVYHEAARIVVVPQMAGQTEDDREHNPPTVGTVLVVSAGTADQPVAEEAAVTASELGSPVERLYDVGVAGLHRLLDQRDRLFAANVIIVVAGMEGALASVVGGLVGRPVVAVPTSVGYGANFQGLSALLTMLNSCATGVAVMNIDNGFGAGCFAHAVNTGGRDHGARSHSGPAAGIA